MPDLRILTGKPAAEQQLASASVVEALIHRADDIANRFKLLSANQPYRTFSSDLLPEDISALAAQLAAATWKRMADEVPSYAFAEKIGRRYHQAEAPVSALLLHWQLFRRAIHLALAERQIRTGLGNEDMLRQASLMNYTIDWAIEASLVAYIISD